MHLKDELDPGFARRQRRVERAGWGVMILLIAASLLGVFGTGILSSGLLVHDEAGHHYEVEYARLTRYEHAERMHVRVHAPQAQGDELQVSFSKEFLDAYLVHSASPQPASGGFGPEGAAYTFRVEDWSQPFTVTFEVEARKVWWTPADVSVRAGNATAARFSIPAWVYP